MSAQIPADAQSLQILSRLENQEKQILLMKEQLRSLQAERNLSSASDSSARFSFMSSDFEKPGSAQDALQIRLDALNYRDQLLSETLAQCEAMKQTAAALLEDCWYAFKEKLENAGITREEIAGAMVYLQEGMDALQTEGIIQVFQ